jgi:hypothetical protein
MNLSVVSPSLDDVIELWIGQGVRVLGAVNPEPHSRERGGTVD